MIFIVLEGMLSRKREQKNIYLLLILLVSILFGGSIFINILPSNPLFEKNILAQLAPQGFAFYSKSPTDDTIIIHKSSPKVNIPNASPKNF